MRARIYQPPKTAMQSGRAGTDKWVLEFEPQSPHRPDPLMGWIGSADTQPQVRLQFDTREEAVAFAERQGIAYEVEIPHERRVRPKAYAENFAYTRRELWTH
ncbi:MAG TPA: ETC complex I subunit [Acetobacteraceae bacterium]|nr:ETC complex I subunit [Acetobacteraceae bacterium]